MNNSQISDSFGLLSKLIDIHGDNSFKAKTYSIASFNIDKLPKQLSEMTDIEIKNLKGLGPAVQSKIKEILNAGTINELEEYLNNTPDGILEFMNIRGLGPKKIHLLWKEAHIETIDELKMACMNGVLRKYKGFSEKQEASILESISELHKNKGLFLYATIDASYETIKSYLDTLFGKKNVLPTGAFRQQDIIINELSFVINDTNENIKPRFKTAVPPELLEETEDSLLYLLTNGIKLRLYNNTKNIVLQQFITSGTNEFIAYFSDKLPTIEKNNFTIEDEIFEAIGINYIEPCLRNNIEWIEKSKQNILPKLISEKDIKGIIHNHSTWSDGQNTIEEMAIFLQKNGFEYLVISDHSKTAAYANGLSIERIEQQHKEIDSLNKTLPSFKIYKSIECDILSDGKLDYEKEILEKFDLVIASIHSNLNMTEEKAMHRLLTAIENPYTTILGHVTGRLLLRRNGYPINHHKIIDACAANHVAIEINANPNRLDLDWSWIQYAVKKNVLLSINPDAHFIEGFSDIKYGVLASQKGGLTKEQNLSSFSKNQFENYLLTRKSYIGKLT